jgi:hypothetical protein
MHARAFVITFFCVMQQRDDGCAYVTRCKTVRMVRGCAAIAAEPQNAGRRGIAGLTNQAPRRDHPWRRHPMSIKRSKTLLVGKASGIRTEFCAYMHLLCGRGDIQHQHLL